ncbi:hypothetical protein SAMN05444158_2789 [Bradyrhizobium canariense]|uniref:Uncharacterized protein n=1 Tax=Bradyrhizobium canariense TaxID=255045 RepID=A0A1H1U310_9BRAD|nr:hypothetical protein SAMN05444158_2789 [Bradyrhizobium canariense]
MPGARRTRSLACKGWKAHELVTTSPPGSPGIPARNGFNGLLRALPGDEFLLSPSSADLRFCRTRSGRRHLRQLDTSNGCQDHTTSPSALAPFVRAPGDRSRAPANPPCDAIARPPPPRPPHPMPNVRDDRDTPLSGGRDGAGYGGVSTGRETGKFLRRGLDCPNQRTGRGTGMTAALCGTPTESGIAALVWKPRFSGSCPNPDIAERRHVCDDL